VKCLSQVAKDVVASHGKLVNLFERIQFFLQRLSIYTGVPLTAAMTDLLGKIMGQVLSILALSTKEMTQRRISECNCLDVSLLANHDIERFLMRFVGRTEVEDALDRLDMLTKEETGMTAIRNLAVTHVVEEVTRTMDDNVRTIKDGLQSSLTFMSITANFTLIAQHRHRPAKMSVMPLILPFSTIKAETPPQ
jgi:hypothetical protein